MEDEVTLCAAVMACWPSELDKQHATRAIKAGAIQVIKNTNGAGTPTVERNPGKRNVLAADSLVWRGETRALPPPLWVAMHKPAGYITTGIKGAAKDKGASVREVLSPANPNLRAIGRLDKDTEGLLLFTTQGRWAWQLRLGAGAEAVSKRYRCWLENPATEADLLHWVAGGIKFRNGKVKATAAADGAAGAVVVAKPALKAEYVEGESTVVDVTIIEGKNRQVRRMWASPALGCNHVVRLLRLDYGPIALDGLSVGECRVLAPEDVEAFRQTCEGGGSDGGGSGGGGSGYTLMLAILHIQVEVASRKTAALRSGCHTMVVEVGQPICPGKRGSESGY
eukprot:gene19510-32965_t